MVDLLFFKKLVWSWCDEAALAYAVAVAALWRCCGSWLSFFFFGRNVTTV